MSRFLYFLGGCAAGALAVAAVQALTDDSSSSSASSPSLSSFSSCDEAEDDVDSSVFTDNIPETCEAATQGMAAAMSTLFAEATKAEDNLCPESTAPDMQKMSEQLTSSVIGIVNAFLRQSQAAQKQHHGPMHSATPPTESDAPASTDDVPASPITPNFGSAQACQA